MRAQAPTCPNCDTVMVLRYEPDEVHGLWYECTICDYRIVADAAGLEAEGQRRHSPAR